MPRTLQVPVTEAPQGDYDRRQGQTDRFDGSLKREGDSVNTAMAIELQRVKNQMSVLSHDSRGGISAAAGALELVIANPDLPEDLRAILLGARSSLHDVADMYDGVLDSQKAQSNNISEISLHGSLSRWVDGMKYRKPGVSLDLYIDKAVEDGLMCDKEKLMRIIQNLISNALKFTHEGSVKLSVKVDDSIEGNIKFRVSDTGIGIPVSEIDNIFEKNVQARSGDEGTGLGLPIVRELIEIMGGDGIKVASQVGVGTEFTFSLPMKAVKKNHKHPLQSEAIDIEPHKNDLKIMLVDDDAFNGLLLSSISSGAGYETFSYMEFPAEALNSVRDTMPDVIIVDYQMPEMTGIEFVREFLKIPGSEDVKIVIYTASCGDEMEKLRTQYQSLGVTHKLNKPLGRGELKVLLDGILHEKLENQ